MAKGRPSVVSYSSLMTLQFPQEDVLVSKKYTLNYVEIVEPHAGSLFSFSFCVSMYVWYMYICVCMFVCRWVDAYMCKYVDVPVQTPG